MLSLTCGDNAKRAKHGISNRLKGSRHPFSYPWHHNCHWYVKLYEICAINGQPIGALDNHMKPEKKQKHLGDDFPY